MTAYSAGVVVVKDVFIFPLFAKHVKALFDTDYKQAIDLKWARALACWLTLLESSGFDASNSTASPLEQRTVLLLSFAVLGGCSGYVRGCLDVLLRRFRLHVHTCPVEKRRADILNLARTSGLAV